jgi:hypothetical protein
MCVLIVSLGLPCYWYGVAKLEIATACAAGIYTATHQVHRTYRICYTSYACTWSGTKWYMYTILHHLHRCMVGMPLLLHTICMLCLHVHIPVQLHA